MGGAQEDLGVGQRPVGPCGIANTRPARTARRAEASKADGQCGENPPAKIIAGLPPQPPVTLDSIRACSPAEMLDCTSSFDYLRLIMNSPEAPVDELIVVSLRKAAAVRPPEEQLTFLRSAGRELAKLMSRDLPRLENVLRRIRP